MNNYVRVRFDTKRECYVSEDGQCLSFTTQVSVLVNGEEVTAKLGFSRRTDDRHGRLTTTRPIPVLRLNGEKVMLDAEEIEVLEACMWRTP